MADMDKIMDELLKTTTEEDELSNEDADIYNGSNHDDISGYDFGNPGEDEEEEYEDEWEYQAEYDEWAEEMDSISGSRCSDVQEMIDTLTEIHDNFINDDDHRYWPDERERIENIISDMKELCDRLYNRAADYRSNPEDW